MGQSHHDLVRHACDERGRSRDPVADDHAEHTRGSRGDRRGRSGVAARVGRVLAVVPARDPGPAQGGAPVRRPSELQRDRVERARSSGAAVSPRGVARAHDLDGPARRGHRRELHRLELRRRDGGRGDGVPRACPRHLGSRGRVANQSRRTRGRGRSRESGPGPDLPSR